MPTISRSLPQALALIAAACAPGTAVPAPERSAEAFAAAESSYAAVRDLRDRVDVALSAGARTTPDGTRLEAVAVRYDSLRARLAARLSAVDSAALVGEDVRAFGLMRRTLARDLGPVSVPVAAPGAAETTPVSARRPDCAYDARAIAAAPNALDSLRARIYACYGWSQSRVAVGGDTLDRLSILGAIGRTDDAARRRELFLALAPVWRSMNGENAARSPYRQLIALEARARGGGESPAAEQARASGVPKMR